MKIFTYIIVLSKRAMANQCSQLSLLLTALLFVTTAIISVVSGQSGGKWLISESDLITLAVFSLSQECTSRSMERQSPMMALS